MKILTFSSRKNLTPATLVNRIHPRETLWRWQPCFSSSIEWNNRADADQTWHGGPPLIKSTCPSIWWCRLFGSLRSRDTVIGIPALLHDSPASQPIYGSIKNEREKKRFFMLMKSFTLGSNWNDKHQWFRMIEFECIPSRLFIFSSLLGYWYTCKVESNRR